MKNIIIFVFLALISNIINDNIIGTDCSTKEILDSSSMIDEDYAYSDRKRVYNHFASCASLTTEEGEICCYIKVKFKNNDSDSKYTHRGCIALSIDDYNNIKNKIKEIENAIDGEDLYKKTDVDIDCKSKFIQLTSFILLSLLL